LGHLCFRREKVHGGSTEGSYPLDKAIGLQPRQKATLWVEMRACHLATGNTYRPAAELLSAEIGDEVSHGAVWSRVQKSGKALRKEEDERRETVFEYGEVFEGDGEEREIVITEMDATMLHSQEKDRKKLTVKLGVMYSGKELESETAKYKRYRLKEKTLYGGVEDPDEFGEKLYISRGRRSSASLKPDTNWYLVMATPGSGILPEALTSWPPTNWIGGTSWSRSARPLPTNRSWCRS
jgi:hypothetical protein